MSYKRILTWQQEVEKAQAELHRAQIAVQHAQAVLTMCQTAAAAVAK